MMDEVGRAMHLAIDAIATAIRRSEQAIVKFAPGTAQHSLLLHRIRALETAKALLSMETGDRRPLDLLDEDLRNAVAPLISLLHKSEKARTKLATGTWQAVMLDEEIAAMRTAMPLLTKALDQINGGVGLMPTAER